MRTTVHTNLSTKIHINTGNLIIDPLRPGLYKYEKKLTNFINELSQKDQICKKSYFGKLPVTIPLQSKIRSKSVQVKKLDLKYDIQKISRQYYLNDYQLEQKRKQDEQLKIQKQERKLAKKKEIEDRKQKLFDEDDIDNLSIYSDDVNLKTQQGLNSQQRQKIIYQNPPSIIQLDDDQLENYGLNPQITNDIPQDKSKRKDIKKFTNRMSQQFSQKITEYMKSQQQQETYKKTLIKSIQRASDSSERNQELYNQDLFKNLKRKSVFQKVIGNINMK